MDQSKRGDRVRNQRTGVAGGRTGSPEGYEGHGMQDDAVERPCGPPSAVGEPAERARAERDSTPGEPGGASEKATEPTD